MPKEAQGEGAVQWGLRYMAGLCLKAYRSRSAESAQPRQVGSAQLRLVESGSEGRMRQTLSSRPCAKPLIQAMR